MLYYLAAVLYVLVCFVLMMVILLQQGKGGDLASAFGGGSSQAAFGARSGATVLTRATTVLAVLFLVGALMLNILAQRGPGSVGGRARDGTGAGVWCSADVADNADGTGTETGGSGLGGSSSCGSGTGELGTGGTRKAGALEENLS